MYEKSAEEHGRGPDSFCEALLWDLQDWARMAVFCGAQHHTHLSPSAHHIVLKGSFTYSVRVC